VYHPGELAVQRRAGVTDRAARLEGMFMSEVPDVAAEFLAAQPWIVLGAADERDRVWAGALYGPPGFVSVPSPSTVHVAARPLVGDPLQHALDGPVGGLALEPGTRRRMRLNGTAWSDASGVWIELEQVYSNCPKYIATRHVEAVEPSTPVRHAGTELDAPAAELLAAADTAFVATRAPAGVDVSHKGGNPGFLDVLDAHTLEWPDYTGNAMFNTLGNIVLDPATGLTVIDPTTGTTLQLSGRAALRWGDERRFIRLTVDAAVRSEHAAPLRWALDRPARNPPLR
jgi:predicted pyridoxine 5'-phosphate oxidase superfamily flavin-nucleotide-binding protein